jgi:hypothetical protein
VVVLLGAAVEHARVAAGSELPVELELEVAVLVLGDEVALLLPSLTRTPSSTAQPAGTSGDL